MKHHLKRIYRNLYLKSPLLFRIDTIFLHIMRKTISPAKKCVVDKTTDLRDIKSLHELLEFLDNTGSAVYGREIIEGYAESANRTILLVSHDLSLTGAPIVLLHMASSLKRKGYQTIIISGLDGDKYLENAAQMGIPVIYYPELLKSDLILRIRKLFSKIIVNTIVCAHIIDLLNGMDSSVIWWIHESNSCYNRGIAKKMPYRTADNIHIYTVGPHARKVLLSRFPQYKAKNLIYGISDLTRATNNSDYNIALPDKKIFALIGSVLYRKGQDILAHAIELLPEKVRKECFFLFIGYNSEPKITGMLNRLNSKYPENVRYIDEIDFNSICRLYNDIDFLICASRDDPMPVVIAESMFLGKPCICSEYTGSATIVDHFNSGYVYCHNSSSELARRIEEAFYLDNDKYEALSKNARRTFEHVFSERAFENKLDKCLERM